MERRPVMVRRRDFGYQTRKGDEGILSQNIMNLPQGGHGGRGRTTELISRGYYWPKVREDIKRLIKTCDTGQRTKVVRHTPYGLLQSNKASNQLCKSIVMDSIPDRLKSEGYHTILVVIDRLTKMSHFIRCSKDLDALQFAMLIMKEVIRLHGVPHYIITDRGTLCTSDPWEETMGK